MADSTNPYSIASPQWPGLGKLVEECGEVIQVLGKLMVAPDKDHTWQQPDGTTRGSGDLGEALTEELGDLLAAIGFFMEFNSDQLDEVGIFKRCTSKFETFTKWHAEGHLDSTS